MKLKLNLMKLATTTTGSGFAFHCRMKKFLKHSLLFVSAILISHQSLGGDQIIVMQEEGLFGRRFRVEVPTNADGEPVPITVVRETNGKSQSIFFSTVRPRPERRAQPEAQFINPVSTVLFKDLQFIIDGSGKKIAAAYPFLPNRQIFITALHALQTAKFENLDIENTPRWGLQDEKSGELLDIAIISKQTDTRILKDDLIGLIDMDKTIDTATVDHLNVVDVRDELILSKSNLKITSSNEGYIFYKNTSQSMIGYASSGAIIYNDRTGRAHSIVTCASNVPLNKGESASLNRALKLETIIRYKLVELTPEMINGFEKLPCDSQDGRRAGGP